MPKIASKIDPSFDGAALDADRLGETPNAKVMTAIERGKLALDLGQLANVSGAANAITADLPVGVDAYANGQILNFFPVAANTGPVTLQLGALAAMPVVDELQQPLQAGDLVIGKAYALRVTASAPGFFRITSSFNSPRRILTSPAMTGTPTAPRPASANNTAQVATAEFVQGLLNTPIRTLSDQTGTNDMVASAPLGMTAYATSQIYMFRKAGGNNTGPVTINIGGLGALPVRDGNNVELAADDLVNNAWYLIRNVAGTRFDVISPSPLPKTIAASILANVSTTIAPLSQGAGRGNARVGYSWAPNLASDPYFKQAGATVAWSGSALNIVAKNGMRSVEIPAQGSAAANRRWLNWVDLANVPDGTPVSISLIVTEKNGASGTGHRARLYGFAADGSAIAIGGATLSGNDGGEATAYGRYFPAEAITSPRQLTIWEGFPKPGGVAKLAFDVRMQDSPATYISGFCVRIGTDPAIPQDFSQAVGVSTAQRTATVSTAGNNANAGTAAAPLATLQAAVTAIGGDGTIYLEPGDYSQLQKIDPATVTGRVRLIGKRAAAPYYDRYPRIFLASPVAGITKTDGRTKIYQAAVSGLPTLANFNWAYQEGVTDPRTLIADEDRQPAHRGRSHRLMNTAKLVKTTATTLADALDEIDAAGANEPKAFVDNGVLYFSIVGGGDGTAASIYLDGTGLVNTASRESCGQIEIQGVELRYGGVDLTPFRYAKLSECKVIGGRSNAVDYSVLEFWNLETACAGSMGGTVGDGLNGHLGAKVIGFSLYSHDNQDDCFSDHEGCSSRLFGGLGEASGGTCLAPAYGADHEAYNFTSLRNQTIAGRKPAAFNVVGAPSGSGAPDDGVDTRALWVGCVSIGDTCGFMDSGSIASRGIARDCKVRDMRAGATYGYAGTMQIEDCGFSSANGSAKAAYVAVKNTQTVA